MEKTGQEMSAAEVAEVLELLKAAAKQSDIRIAQRAAMPRNTWRNKLTGRSELTLSEALRIAGAFGVPVELFLMPAEQAKQWVHDRWDMIKLYGQNEYSAYIDLTHFVHRGQGTLPLFEMAA